MQPITATAPRGHTARYLMAIAIGLAVMLAACGGADPVTAGAATAPPTHDRTAPDDAHTTPDERTDGPAAGPAARIYHPLVGDGERLYVLGGLTEHGWGEGLLDVWAYDVEQARWEQRGAPAAGEVGHPAYDSGSERFVMLDADGGTWAYDPSTDTWEERHPAHAPSPRCGERTVYDAQSDLVVLYGGFACTSTADPGLDDTWTYDYETDTWERMRPDRSPPGRMFHGMVYDDASDRTVVWGGRVDDTRVWTYDAETDRWTAHRGRGGPSNMRSYHGMSYDPSGERVLIFGGLELAHPQALSGTLLGDVWAYDVRDDRWTELEVDGGPEPRALHQMAFDPPTGTHIVFGGELTSAYSDDVTNEVWAFDPATATWMRPKPDASGR